MAMRIALTALLLLSACDAASPEAAPEPTSAPEADEGPPDAAPIERPIDCQWP